MIYIYLVDLYLLFSRAYHTNDLELSPSVFIKSAQYSLLRVALIMPGGYHLDLLNIDETHPGARAMLEARALTFQETINHSLEAQLT